MSWKRKKVERRKREGEVGRRGAKQGSRSTLELREARVLRARFDAQDVHLKRGELERCL